MKTRRLELDKRLREILQEETGQVNLYFQPPEGFKLTYPCIIYKKDTGDHMFADNSVYQFTQAYQLTYIDKNPDNTVVERILKEFKWAKYGRSYQAENINHDVIILYY